MLKYSYHLPDFIIILTRQSTHLFPFFFFNDTATTEIYTLSLHDALPIQSAPTPLGPLNLWADIDSRSTPSARTRSEEHTSELQSRENLVCRLLLEKKKKRRSQ